MSIDLSLTPRTCWYRRACATSWHARSRPTSGLGPRTRRTARCSTGWPSSGYPGRAHLGALGRRGHGLHQSGHPVRGAGASRHGLSGGHERPRRAQLPDAHAMGDRGAEAALAGAPGARREAGHVRAHGAGRGHGRRGHHHDGYAATATRMCSTAPSCGSASRTSPTTSWCSRPSTGRCGTGASRRSCWNGAWPVCPRAPSRASWASMRATPVPSRSTTCGCPSSTASARRARGSPSR